MSAVTLFVSMAVSSVRSSDWPASTTGTSRSANDAVNSSGAARSLLVRHSTGSSPPTYAATRARSTKPVRGGGSASAATMSSRSALATTTRSNGSVSSAVRRSTVRRSATRTIRARVSTLPDRSPTMPTSSPTTIGVRPSSRARIVTTGRDGSPSSTQPQRPRSTDTTMPASASLCSGRVLVRGRELLPGRMRTSDSS